MTASPDALPLLVFALRDISCGLPTSGVERVVRAVEISPLPGAPSGVLGLINVRGAVVPVADLQVRLGAEPMELLPEHRLILFRSTLRRWAVVAHTVAGIRHLTGQALPYTPSVRGAAIAEGVVLIYDLEDFLTLEETAALGSTGMV